MAGRQPYFMIRGATVEQPLAHEGYQSIAHDRAKAESLGWVRMKPYHSLAP
jgi:hypothetical protein